MKLKDKISWIMGRLQRSLFPILEECCAAPLTEQEKWLVKILELVEIEKHIPCNRQWMGRPAAERKTIARCYVAKAVFRYPHNGISYSMIGAGLLRANIEGRQHPLAALFGFSRIG